MKLPHTESDHWPIKFLSALTGSRSPHYQEDHLLLPDPFDWAQHQRPLLTASETLQGRQQHCYDLPRIPTWLRSPPALPLLPRIDSVHWQKAAEEALRSSSRMASSLAFPSTSVSQALKLEKEAAARVGTYRVLQVRRAAPLGCLVGHAWRVTTSTSTSQTPS